jgi:hypothetical protein
MGAAAVEPTTTVESTTTVEAAARIATAMEPADRSASITAAITEPGPSIKSAPEATPIESTTVEPGAGADEYATRKVRRAIVAVRCACVRSIAVIAVLACRRPAVVSVAGTHSNTHRNLRLGVNCRNHQDTQ